MKHITLLFCFLIIAIGLEGQCYEDRHNTSRDGAWISCVREASPNPDHGNAHWIMYDFGEAHFLGQTHFWNVNVPGRTNTGIRSAFIDYSLDGINWTTWGTFDLEEAPASGFYEGEAGPDLAGLEARYLLITAIENHGALCTGMGELRVQTVDMSTSVDETERGQISTDISPNPSADRCTLRIEVFTRQSGHIRIYDLTGRLVHAFPVALAEGVNKFSLNVSHFTPGQYVVHINTPAIAKALPLSVQNDR